MAVQFAGLSGIECGQERQPGLMVAFGQETPGSQCFIYLIGIFDYAIDGHHLLAHCHLSI